MSDFLQIAALEENDVKRIREVEKDFGVHVMAFEQELSIAHLSENQLEKIKQLEDELGVTLLVFEK